MPRGRERAHFALLPEEYGSPLQQLVQGRPQTRTKRRKHPGRNRSHPSLFNQLPDGDSAHLFRPATNLFDSVKYLPQISLFAGGWADRGDELAAARDTDALAAGGAVDKFGEFLLGFEEADFTHGQPHYQSRLSF